jgi:hypothetical protein
VWDADLRIVAHLYAGYVLELLEHLQDNDAWKINGLVIGSPAFQLSTSSADNPSQKIEGTRILENQMELHPDHGQVPCKYFRHSSGVNTRVTRDRANATRSSSCKVYI